MKKPSDEENQYIKIKHIVTVLGNILTFAIAFSVIYIVIAIICFSVSYLYLAIGLPIILCLYAVLIFLLYFFAKRERTIKGTIYNTNKLTTTNKIFQEVIEEYYHDQLESLEDLLPKKWKVVDIDDYNNSINIGIEKQHGMQVEVVISETDIAITWESTKSEEETSVSKSLTSSNFPDVSSVLVYIVDICESIDKN